VYRALITFGGIPDVLQVELIISFGKEARLAIVAALNDMLGNSGKTKPGFAGHGTSLCGWQNTSGCHQEDIRILALTPFTVFAEVAA